MNENRHSRRALLITTLILLCMLLAGGVFVIFRIRLRTAALPQAQTSGQNGDPSTAGGTGQAPAAAGHSPSITEQIRSWFGVDAVVDILSADRSVSRDVPMPHASSRHPAQTAGSGNAAAPAAAETPQDATQAVQADPAAATAADGAQSAAPAEETEEVSAAHKLFPELETSAVTSAKDLTKRQKSYIKSWEALHGREFPMGAPLHNYNWKYLEYDENGVLHYEGDEDYTVRRGIDVSEFQGWIDWEAVREAGYDFAFVRVGYRMFDSGDLYEDSRAVKNLKRAKKAGLDVGVYVFSQAVSKKEAREEAKLCLDVIEKSGVEITLPVVFDPEIQIDYYARINYITSEQFTDNAIAFCEAIHKAGRVPAIYANSSTLTDILNMKRITRETDAVIWYADYYGVPETPYQFTFWQYTDLGWVSGISETETDLNLWFVKTEEEQEEPAEEAADQAPEDTETTEKTEASEKVEKTETAGTEEKAEQTESAEPAENAGQKESKETTSEKPADNTEAAAGTETTETAAP